jgi:hypothetical protein
MSKEFGEYKGTMWQVTKMPPAQLLRSFLFNYIYKIIYKLCKKIKTKSSMNKFLPYG